MRKLFAWQNISRLAGLVTLAVELREELIGNSVDPAVLLLAGGLLGIPIAFRNRGGGE